MAGVHIGHDSQVGSHCILANCATLAGHVLIEDFATVGAFCPVHQHCVVGKYAFIGGGTIVTQDVLPFSQDLVAAGEQGLRRSTASAWSGGASAPERIKAAAEGFPAAAGRPS